MNASASLSVPPPHPILVFHNHACLVPRMPGGLLVGVKLLLELSLRLELETLRYVRLSPTHPSRIAWGGAVPLSGLRRSSYRDKRQRVTKDL